MNGATAEPEVKTTRLPRRTKQIIMGSIQNFFRSFIKDHSSNKNSPMVTSLSDSYFQDHDKKCIPGVISVDEIVMFVWGFQAGPCVEIRQTQTAPLP